MKVMLLPEITRDDQRALFPKLAEAMQADGDTAAVHPLRTRPNVDGYDTVVVWGWRIGQQYRDKGKNVLVVERGYVGDRHKWYSMGWNGLNGRAVFARADTGARWEKYFPGALQPWRPHAGYAAVMGQVPSDTAVRGVQFMDWARRAVAAMRIRGYTACFRPHPQAPRSLIQAPIQRGQIADTLAGAAVAVTYNSNAGVDAVLAGVRTIVCDAGSMAKAVAANGLNAELVTPDRTEWAHRIAWAQWLPEEFSLRSTWARLKESLT